MSMRRIVRVFPFVVMLGCPSKPADPTEREAAPRAAAPAATPEAPTPAPATPSTGSPTSATVTFTNSCTQTVWLAQLGNGGSGPCTSDADCNGGNCINGACAQILCTSNGDCNDLQFCDALSCSSDGQCPAKTCTTNADCGGPNQTCDANGQCTPTCATASNQCICTSDADCPAEGQCIDNLCTGGLCRFSLAPSPGYWQLDAGAKQTLELPVGWGGRFWARTGCPTDLATCKGGFEPCTQNADCCNDNCAGPAGAMTCVPGVPACTTGDCQAGAACDVSAGAPISLFEVFFTSATQTWFDVSFVDGANLSLTANPVDADGNALTSCTPANRGGCTSAFDATALASLAVAGTTTCVQDSDCPFLGECSQGQCVIGYSGACDACNAGATNLDCSANQDLYCCTGPNAATCNDGNPVCMDDADCPTGGTCNANHVCTPVTVTCKQDSDCAANYVCDPTLSACLPGPALAASCCGPFNPAWRAAMQPLAQPFKDACPNAYAYQFDDPSSNTQCPTLANFEVELCGLN